MLPREELDRVDNALLEQYYIHDSAGETARSGETAGSDAQKGDGAR
jgi:hypothetical protein